MITDIVIPVRNNLPLTQGIVSQLQQQDGWRHCRILDNGSDDGTSEWLMDLTYQDDRFYPSSEPGKNIYELWSQGFEESRANGSKYVAILNNDLTLAPDTILAMNQHMDQNAYTSLVYPDYNIPVASGSLWQGGYRYTEGTYRHGGMSGYCFMLRVSAVTWSPPLVDPKYQIWYGDDHIAFSVQEAGGKQARLVGLPLDHLGQATCNQFPELFVDIPDDKFHFETKWGRNQ